jgi:hypothetical protein
MNEASENKELSFVETLNNRIKESRISIENLNKSTGVPMNYLEALVSGDFNILPATPYVKGYLRQIAPALNCSSDELWSLFEKATVIKVSGATDRLPGNRFATPKTKPTVWIWVGIGGLILLGYFLLNGSRIVGQPILEIYNLETERTTVNTPEIIIKGNISPNDTLTINNQIIEIDPLGNFEENYLFDEGLNTVNFRVKRFLGRELNLVRYVFYEPNNAIENSAFISPATSPVF